MTIKLLMCDLGNTGNLAGECLFIGDYYTDKYAAESAGCWYRDISEFK